jgi:DNA polymerase IV
LAEEDEEHSDTEKPMMQSKRVKFQKSWQQNFSCMIKHDGKVDQNPNSRTIDILQQMLDYYSCTDDHWRTIAYRKAISALRKHPTRVMTMEQALAIPFIGDRLAAKIEEIVWTDRLRRLDNTNREPNDLTLQTFLKIYGVGLAQATKWINQGHRTISDLVSKAHLTKNQLIGIQHYDDFQTRIPRKEVESHGQFLRTIIQKIDPTIQITIGGSYRRGAPDSGDVDFILTKPNSPISTLRTIIFHTVLPLLQKRNYLKATLARSSSNDAGSKWHGAATLPGFGPIWRRVDLLLVPWNEMGAALIYFTGNDIFNRSIRLLARKKGMRLNQRGLWRDVLREGGTSTQGALVEGQSEERIFEMLRVPYRPPEHRIC